MSLPKSSRASNSSSRSGRRGNRAFRQRLSIGFKNLLLAFIAGLATAQQNPQKTSQFPYPEKLSYRIEWRLVTAGTANIQLSHPSSDDWQLDLTLESAGMVSRLYKVLDTYKVVVNDHFCASNLMLDAQEGKRHRLTRLKFDNSRHNVEYDERDLLNKTTTTRVLNIAPCTHDVVGALAAIRAMNLEPGKSATLSITDGKKIVNARIDAQARENVAIGGKTYHSIRYEAFLFDNALYKRKGRLLIWLTDDQDRIPVQLRFHLGFPIGTISVTLDKREWQ